MLVGRGCIGGRVATGEIADGRFFILDGDVYSRSWRSGISERLVNVALVAPSEPRQVFALLVGGFVPEEGSAITPDTPPLFEPKLVSYVAGDHALIRRPNYLTSPLRIEVELGVVIGKLLIRADAEEAEAAIFGYTISNEVSAGQYAERLGDRTRSKSGESFVSFGPWIRTDIDEDQLAKGLAMAARVNGHEVKSGSTKTLRHPPSVVLSAISQHVPLYPGDMVSLGAPSGPADAQPGDNVELEIEGIGILHNRLE